MNPRAIFDRPFGSPGSWNALVSPSKSEKCVCMPEPCTLLQRLRHERGVHAVLVRDLLHDEPERHDVVGHRERVGVAQVDLVLARRVLVVGVLDRDAHRLERVDRLLAEVAGDVGRGEVEVRRRVERPRRLAGVGVAK